MLLYYLVANRFWPWDLETEIKQRKTLTWAMVMISVTIKLLLSAPQQLDKTEMRTTNMTRSLKKWLSMTETATQRKKGSAIQIQTGSNSAPICAATTLLRTASTKRGASTTREQWRTPPAGLARRKWYALKCQMRIWRRSWILASAPTILRSE